MSGRSDRGGFVFIMIPDVVQSLNATLHREFAFQMVQWPSEMMPTNEEQLTASELSQRTHFWVSAVCFTYLLTVFLGTSIMWIGRPPYELLKSPQKVLYRRALTSASFCAHYLLCVWAAVWSSSTGRLSKEHGLDWELYYLLFAGSCVWMLCQAVSARALNPEIYYSASAFFKATLSTVVPFLADPVDTPKDAMFGGLCVCSSHTFLKVLGVISWVWLAVVHVGLFAFDEVLLELSVGYAGVFYSTETQGYPSDTSHNWCNSNRSSCLSRAREWLANVANHPATWCSQKAMPLMVVLYKQTTTAKKRTIVWEDTPQTLMAVAYFFCEGGLSQLVFLCNIMLPVGKLLFAYLMGGCLAKLVVPWLAEEFVCARKHAHFDKAEMIKNTLANSLETQELALRQLDDDSNVRLTVAWILTEQQFYLNKYGQFQFWNRKSSDDVEAAACLAVILTDPDVDVRRAAVQ
ncbi:unnamed protein product, partial [Polarella glacialis]